MTFIPEDNELLSDWLDREARELFRGEYPGEITDSDVDEFLKKHPVRHSKPAKWKLRPTRADAALIRSVNRSLGVMVDAPTAFGDPTLDAPLIRKGVAAFQVEIGKLLRDRRAVARHVLESQRVDLIKKLKWRAFEHHRQRFYSGSLKSLVVRADGSKLEIERSVWGSEYATRLVADCSFEGRPILVPRPSSSLAPEIKPARGTIAAETRATNWLIDLMRGSPNVKIYSRDYLRLEAATLFQVGSRSFDRAWRKALDVVGPKIARIWKAVGRIPIKSKQRIDTPK